MQDRVAAFRESWLGIPRVEQPVNHYRLLRLPRDASEREILQAYETRLQWLQAELRGPNGAIARQLIGEIQVARDTLAVPLARHAYDRELDSRPRSRAAAAAASTQARRAPNLLSRLSSIPRHIGGAPKVWGIGAATIGTVVVLLLLSRGPSPRQLASDDPPAVAKSSTRDLSQKTNHRDSTDRAAAEDLSAVAANPSEELASRVGAANLPPSDDAQTDEEVLAAIIDVSLPPRGEENLKTPPLPAELSLPAETLSPAPRALSGGPLEKPTSKTGAPSEVSPKPPAADKAIPEPAAAEPAHPSGADEPLPKTIKEIRVIRGAFQKAFANKSPALRAAAIDLLADVPHPETVSVLMRLGLHDKSADVRKKATDLLEKFQERPEIARFLFGNLEQSTQEDASGKTTYAIVRVLGHSRDAALRRAAAQALERAMDNSADGARVVFQVVDEVGLQADSSTISSLSLLSNLRYFEVNFGYRRAVVHALIRSHQVDSLPLLISSIATSKGLILQEAIEYLTQATGQPFQADVSGWQKWWEEHHTTFKFGQPVAAAAVAAPARPAAFANPAAVDISQYSKYVEERTPKYYKIPIYANRIVFIIDTSGSMHGARLFAAQRELVSAIAQLPETAEFNVIFFSSGVRAWQPNLVTADSYAKAAAAELVLAQVAHGSTASYDALLAAFNLNPEMIFFLSDGEPTTGQLVNPADIVTAISALNFTRRVSLHTIEVGTTLPFMRFLAANNCGNYVIVSQ